MNRIAPVAAVVVLAALAQIGCASEDDRPAPPPREQQTISGKIDTGAMHTKSLAPLADVGLGEGNVAASNGQNSAAVSGHDGQLHVVAHRLGSKTEGKTADVDGIVAADGSFQLKLDRGARYVFEVERGSASVAFFGWSSKADAKKKTTVLGISSATKGHAEVSLGRVKVVGNGAVAEHCLCDSFDENDTTGIDVNANWFVSAKGALMTSEEALEEAAAALAQAQEALAQASVALGEAGEELDKAKDALEAARVQAGGK